MDIQPLARSSANVGDLNWSLTTLMVFPFSISPFAHNTKFDLLILSVIP